MSVWVDAHTHLDHYTPAQRPEALRQIDAGPIWTLANAVDLDSYRETVALAEGRAHIVTGLAVHPWEAADWAGRLAEIEPLLDGAVFYGELGLDHHWVSDQNAYPKQREVFTFFLEAAARRGKLVNLHTKGAEGEILALLDRYRIERAIIHWYSGPEDIFGALVERGYGFTIGTDISYSEQVRSFARRIPLPQLLTETDGPTPLERRTGQIAWPAQIEAITAEVARLRGMEADALRRVIGDNFQRYLPEALADGRRDGPPRGL